MVIIVLTKYRLAWLILKFPTTCKARLEEDVAFLIAAFAIRVSEQPVMLFKLIYGCFFFLLAQRPD